MSLWMHDADGDGGFLGNAATDTAVLWHWMIQMLVPGYRTGSNNPVTTTPTDRPYRAINRNHGSLGPRHEDLARAVAAAAWPDMNLGAVRACHDKPVATIESRVGAGT